MLGASRGSLAALSAMIDTRRTDPAMGTLGAELFAVCDLLGRDKQLRVALADSGQPSATREGVVRQLFGSRVSALAVDVLVAVAASRWSTDEDLVAAVESLADQAVFITAEGNSTLDSTEDEIFRFGRAVDASSDLQMTLTDPALAGAAKSAIVRDLLAGRATEATRTVLEFAVSHLRGRRIDAVVDELADLAARQRQRIVAEVRVAQPLTAEQERRLSAALTRLKGRTVRLNVAIDPEVLGGVHIKVGDEVIDGTVAYRMEQARRALLG